MSKKAIVTGITGQDGVYLSELLLGKGYEVHGIKRRSSTNNTRRIDHLMGDSPDRPGKIMLHEGDLTDPAGLTRIIEEVRPDEIYNLAAQSQVPVSFDCPEYTANVDGLGVLRLLEAIRQSGMGEKVRFFQASTSELFGMAEESPQRETTPFRPRNPYAVAKLYGYWIAVNYRQAYGIYASNGIMYNHESPVRGETFVTRKITRSVARIRLGLQDKLFIGNLESRRDWGHARDYAEGMWLILQQPAPDDFVLATGETHSIRELVELAFRRAGFRLEWRGEGLGEQGLDAEDGRVLVEVDPQYYRPDEAVMLRGDATKARTLLGWTPKTGFAELIGSMVDRDLNELQRQAAAEGRNE